MKALAVMTVAALLAISVPADAGAPLDRVLLKQGKELYEAKRSDDELLDFLASGAAVDAHLADQLVPFLALPSSPSSITCPALSPRLRTVAWTVQQFLPVRIEFGEGRPKTVPVTSGSRRAPSGPD